MFRTGLSCMETYFLGRVHRGGKSYFKTPLWCLIWRCTGSFLVDLAIAKREPTWNYTSRNKILQGLFCWQICFEILQILAVSHNSPKAKKNRCPEVAKQHDDSSIPQDHQMSSAGSLKITSQCWARGKSWGSGMALEIIFLISVSCGFSFLQKQNPVWK